jgi:proteasome lid subunit RPN8/RPN11
MRRAIPLLFTLLLAFPAFATDDIYDSAVGHRCLVELLRKSAWGLGGPFERAEFIIANPDGTVTCDEWPSNHGYQAEHYTGAIPKNAIAIVHTHPVQYPRPSAQDEEEASKLGIPVYTLTIRAVYKSLPAQKQPELVTDRQSWIKETPASTASLRPNKLPVDVQSDGLSNK